MSEALGKIYQMYDDLQDLRVAIQVGLLSLSYSLAVLLDNPQELDADSYAILEKITREREILPSDVEKVNKIFSSKADYIANAVEQEIKKLATLISLPHRRVRQGGDRENSPACQPRVLLGVSSAYFKAMNKVKKGEKRCQEPFFLGGGG